MPDGLIVDNVVTFLMAGHETTSRALTWTLYLLALFPEWQGRVREEVLGVASGGGIGRDEIAKLSLLDAVFQETMRLYPPAPMLMRRTVKPVQLGGVAIGAGTTVNIPIYVVHRHRLLWDDPLAFEPSRSPLKQELDAIAAPMCRSGQARGPVSGAPSPCWRGRRSSPRCSRGRASRFLTARWG
jgi:cytochrome P450